MILDKPEMVVEFFNNFVSIDILKNINPADIEDVSERFLSMDSNQRDGDTVKRINLKEHGVLFVITIIEHESTVNFRAPFKMLLYITKILDAHENEITTKAQKEEEKLAKAEGRVAKTIKPTYLKGYKYPPILPIIFYDGSTKWTAEMNFLHKTEMHKVFEKYIPKFEYLLVNLNEYSSEKLQEFGNLLSLFMIIDKVKKAEELGNIMSSLPKDYVERVKANAPENLKVLMSDVIRVLLAKLDVPQDEIDVVAERVHEKGVSEMFAMEKYSVQETRRLAKEENDAKWQPVLEAERRRAENERRRAENAEAELAKLRAQLQLVPPNNNPS